LLPKITLASSILQGTTARVAKRSGDQYFCNQSGAPDRTRKIYHGSVQVLLGDTGQEAVLADITAWIVRQLSQGACSAKGLRL
jgi:esterase/lipase